MSLDPSGMQQYNTLWMLENEGAFGALGPNGESGVSFDGNSLPSSVANNFIGLSSQNGTFGSLGQTMFGYCAGNAIANAVQTGQIGSSGASLIASSVTGSGLTYQGGGSGWANVSCDLNVGITSGNIDAALWVLGAAGSLVQGNSGATTVGLQNLKLYPSGWAGNGSVETVGLGNVAGAVGGGLAAYQFVSDWSDPNVSQAKMNVNTTISAIGLWGGPIGVTAAAVYYGVDTFVPGGWGTRPANVQGVNDSIGWFFFGSSTGN